MRAKMFQNLIMDIKSSMNAAGDVPVWSLSDQRDLDRQLIDDIKMHRPITPNQNIDDGMIAGILFRVGFVDLNEEALYEAVVAKRTNLVRLLVTNGVNPAALDGAIRRAALESEDEELMDIVGIVDDRLQRRLKRSRLS